MNTCDTCQFWELPLKEWPARFGNPSIPIGSYGKCLKGIGSCGQFPPIDGCYADSRVDDGSGYGRTGPKFGCIHHKPKA
jgi:hypothetical protein